MQSVLAALRSAGALTELPVAPSSLLAAALQTSTASSPYVVTIGPEPLTGTLTVALGQHDATSATLQVPLDASVTLTIGGHSLTLTGPAGRSLAVDIGIHGASWHDDGGGPITLTVVGSPLQFAAGPISIELSITSAELVLSAGVPAIELKGEFTLAGIPALRVLTVPVALRWDGSGITGAAAPTAGPVAVTLIWSASLDPFPSAFEITAPFTAPASPVPGITASPGSARLRVRGMRSATGFDTTIAVEAGDQGVTRSTDAVAAAFSVLATATAAETAGAGGPDGAAGIAALVASAEGLVHALSPAAGPPAAGSVTVTAARFAIHDGQLNLHELDVDYIADLSCKFDAGLLAAETHAPIRVAVRGARLGITDPATPVLSLVGATIDLVDPGQWAITRPAGLLQVTGIRSGHGSSWFELDLRFALDLGPIEVEGAVLRTTLVPRLHTRVPSLHTEVRGFGLGIHIPGLIDGQGQLALGDEGGFSAAVSLQLVPLSLRASGALIRQVDGGFTSLLVMIAIDLPAPIPLAATGLGLFGIAGLVGLHRTASGSGLDWTPDPRNTRPDPAKQMFGASLAIGTLPDLAVAFSAVGRVVVTTPELAVRAAVDASILSGPRHVTDPVNTQPTAGIKGVLVIDPQVGTYAGVTGTVDIPPSSSFELLKVTVPVEVRYPVADPSRWFVHIGTDGNRGPGAPGPVKVEVLPDLFGASGEGFLMVHGHGFNPKVGALPAIGDGLAIAAGFALSLSYGVPPVWADIHVGAQAIVGTRPAYTAGTARAGGSLHLGPFSLGLDTILTFQAGPGSTRLAGLHACASIDLWFTEISGCVDISFGSATHPLPDKPDDPLVSATVADVEGQHHGMTPGALTLGPAQAPAMWPDGTILLGFNPAPKLTGPAGCFDHDLKAGGPGTSAATDGTLGPGAAYHALWELTSLSLHDQTAGTEVTRPAPAQWQIPPAGPSPTGPGARILSLLTTHPALWALNMLASPATLPGDPAAVARRNCDMTWKPEPGWVAGGLAAPADGPEWLLPSLQVGSSPLATTITASLQTSVRLPDGRRVPLGGSSTVLLTGGTSLIPAGPVASDPVGAGPGLPGWLPLADVAVTEKTLFGDVETTVTFDDDLLDGATTGSEPTLVLLTKAAPGEGIVTNAATGQRWTLADVRTGPGGWKIAIYAWKSAGSVRTLKILHGRLIGDSTPVQPQLAIAGAGGVSQAAHDSAGTANRIGAAAASASQAGLPKTGAALLQEGRTYRLHHDWSGSTKPDPGVPNGGRVDHYLRIASHADHPPPPDERYRVIDTFHPLMLGRYLAAYLPDGSWPWFTADPVQAVLTRASISEVARAYGYNLKLAVTRTDPPPAAAAPGESVPQVLDVALTPTIHSEFLAPIDTYARQAGGGHCPGRMAPSTRPPPPRWPPAPPTISPWHSTRS